MTDLDVVGEMGRGGVGEVVCDSHMERREGGQVLNGGSTERTERRRKIMCNFKVTLTWTYQGNTIYR